MPNGEHTGLWIELSLSKDYSSLLSKVFGQQAFSQPKEFWFRKKWFVSGSRSRHISPATIPAEYSVSL